MFARGNIAATSLSRGKKLEELKKTDSQLLAEIAEEELLGEENDAEEENRAEAEFRAQFAQYNNPVVQAYGRLAYFAHDLVRGRGEAPFNILIMVAILTAGILVGVETYDEFAGSDALYALDLAIVSVFALEIAAKIMAEGVRPHLFFVGPSWAWNSFDFLIVLVCMPKLSDSFGNASPTVRLVSRLFRLMRVAKIVRSIPALQVIVRGLIGGLKSIVYVAILLLLIFYIWGVFGVFLFRANDPFFFRDVQTALISLFRICTLEGWSEVLYINTYGCDVYDANIYVSLDSVSSSVWDALPDMYKCTSPAAQPELAGAFFISFTLISSLVMLSLFVGVITMNMQESLDEMRAEAEEATRKKVLAKHMHEMQSLSKSQAAQAVAKTLAFDSHAHKHAHDKEANSTNSRSRSRSRNGNSIDSSSSSEDERGFAARLRHMLRHFRGSRRNADGTVVKYLTHKEKRKMADMAEMRGLLMQAWAGTAKAKDYHHDLDITQEGTLEKYIRNGGVLARHIMENRNFQNFITLVILLTAIVVGLEANAPNPTAEETAAFEAIEDLIFVIFTLEVALRIAADEFHLKEYFSNYWNVFDFVVVLVTKVPGGGVFIVLLRLVRLLRVLKLVKFLPQLAVIVNALLMALSSIGYILMIMFLTFYLFAVLGIIAFKQNDAANFGNLGIDVKQPFLARVLRNVVEESPPTTITSAILVSLVSSFVWQCVIHVSCFKIDQKLLSPLSFFF